jgi:uncharacterized membrane protein
LDALPEGTIIFGLGGWSWLNNDMVNLGCALMGAVIGMIL